MALGLGQRAHVVNELQGRREIAKAELAFDARRRARQFPAWGLFEKFLRIRLCQRRNTALAGNANFCCQFFVHSSDCTA
jgi:hypothetical protein